MATQAQPLVSVITPFYNTASYLVQCLASVLNQSWENFEYILVDNCSTDGSGEIAETFVCADPRVRLIRTPEFLGQVENYNFALSQITPTSEFVKIVQADDWIHPDCLVRMVEVARQSTKIGIVGSYYMDGNHLKGVGLPFPRNWFSGRDICRDQLLNGSFYFGTPSSVMFRAEIVRARRPFYALNRYHEDTELCYEVLSEWDFGFAHHILSYLRMDDRSISGQTRHFNPHILDRLITLRVYGRRFLAEHEYHKSLRILNQRYRRFLGESALRGRDAEFWAYHRRGLETIGEQLTPQTRTLVAAMALVQLLLNPIETSGRLRQRLIARRGVPWMPR